MNAECYVQGYEIKCRCFSGYEGDPLIRCTSKPDNPCDSSPCGPNTHCTVADNNKAKCTCLPLFFGDAYSDDGCDPECVRDSDCPSSKMCINTQCQDACLGACGIRAKCEVKQHRPVCYCEEGTFGDPYAACYTIVSQKNPCQPSPCGRGTNCRVQGNEAVCSCITGYKGDPFTECKPECVINSDCSEDKACSKLKCINPCDNVCGINAECEVHNHNPICFCPSHLTGDPFSHCVEKGNKGIYPKFL